MGFDSPTEHMNNMVAVRPTTNTDGAVAKLLAARRWIESAAPAELADTLSDVRKMGEWLRVVDAAEDLRKQALELEYLAMRRIGGTEYVKQLGSTQRHAAARWLAQMPEATFEALLAEIGVNYSPIAAYRAHLSRQREQETGEHLGRVRRGGDVAQIVAWAENAERDARLGNATRTILEELIRDGEPFKTSDVALRVAVALGIDSDEIAQEDIAQGLVGVVNSAISRGVGGVREMYIDGDPVRMPSVVTVDDGELGWVKVNFWEASLPQLLAMASDHERRAEAAVARAAELRRIADFFAERAKSPDERLVDIERRARLSRRLKD